MTVDVPAAPAAVPPLEVSVAGIRGFADQLLAASARLDDHGSFVAGDARLGDWRGSDATTYHDSLRPHGRRADAMSLALRKVSQEVDAHADSMGGLLTRRGWYDEQRTAIGRDIGTLESAVQAAAQREATPAEVAELKAMSQDIVDQIGRYDTAVERWLGDVRAEEQAMVRAFEGLAALDKVERRFAGMADPADVALHRMPRNRTPREVNAWWDGLTREAQLAIVAASPGSIGDTDGIPARARSEANETRMLRDLAAWEERERTGTITDDEQTWLDNARAARDALYDTRNRLDPVTLEPLESQLHLYDPAAFEGDGRVALSAGNLDTAENVSISVPGLTNDASTILGNVDDARNLYEASRSLHPGETTATLAWIGYDAPSGDPANFARVGFEGLATEGGNRLADTLDGLRASRDDRAHLTVIGHSYGSTTMGHALSDHDVAVDEAVAIGSPGLGDGADHVGDLDVREGHFFVGRNSDDPVAGLGDKGSVNKGLALGLGLGNDPAEDHFGGQRFQAEDDRVSPLATHTSYYAHDSESLFNLSQIVTGHTGEGDYLAAAPVYDPWYRGAVDPESEATVEHPSTRR